MTKVIPRPLRVSKAGEQRMVDIESTVPDYDANHDRVWRYKHNLNLHPHIEKLYVTFVRLEPSGSTLSFQVLQKSTKHINGHVVEVHIPKHIRGGEYRIEFRVRSK